MLLYKSKGSRSDPSRYRPLSLLDSDLRLLDRLLEHRLQRVVTDLLPDTQSGFVSKRNTHGAALHLHLAIAAVACGLVSQPALLFVNQDQEKAYDRVHRQWLFEVLRHAGFPRPFRSILHTIYSHPSIRYSLGDNITESVHLRRGVLQGLPSSCLIYNIVYQPFLSLLSAQQLGLRFPHGYVLSSVSYADNTAVLLDAHQMPAYQESRIAFDAASDARLNTSTAAHIICKADADPPAWALADAATINTQASRDTDPASQTELLFLGHPFHLRGNIPLLGLSAALTRIKNTMAIRSKWQSSLLDAIVYTNQHLLSCLWHRTRIGSHPESLQRDIEALLCPFLFHGSSRAWVRWEAVMLPRHLGGFGLHHPTAMIAALQGQWLAPLLAQPNSAVGQTFHDQLRRYLQHRLSSSSPTALFHRLRGRPPAQFEQTGSFWPFTLYVFATLKLDLAPDYAEEQDPIHILGLPWFHPIYKSRLDRQDNADQYIRQIRSHGYHAFGDILFFRADADNTDQLDIAPILVRRQLPSRPCYQNPDHPPTRGRVVDPLQWLRRQWDSYYLNLPRELRSALSRAVGQVAKRPPIDGYCQIDADHFPLPTKVTMAAIPVQRYTTAKARIFWFRSQPSLLHPVQNVYVPDGPYLYHGELWHWPRVWSQLLHPLLQIPPLREALSYTYLALHFRLHTFQEQFDPARLHHLNLCAQGCGAPDSGEHAIAACPQARLIWQATWPYLAAWIPSLIPRRYDPTSFRPAHLLGWPHLRLSAEGRLRFRIWHILVLGSIAQLRTSKLQLYKEHRTPPSYTTAEVVQYFLAALQECLAFYHTMTSAKRVSIFDHQQLVDADLNLVVLPPAT